MSSPEVLIGDALCENLRYAPPSAWLTTEREARYRRLVGATSPAGVLGTSVMAPLMVERFVKFDGTPFYAEAVASPLIFEGQPAIQVIMRDQTERHATEEDLQFKSFLLNSVVDGIIVRDAADFCVLL